MNSSNFVQYWTLDIYADVSVKHAQVLDEFMQTGVKSCYYLLKNSQLQQVRIYSKKTAHDLAEKLSNVGGRVDVGYHEYQSWSAEGSYKKQLD